MAAQPAEIYCKPKLIRVINSAICKIDKLSNKNKSARFGMTNFLLKNTITNIAIVAIITRKAASQRGVIEDKAIFVIGQLSAQAIMMQQRIK